MFVLQSGPNRNKKGQHSAMRWFKGATRGTFVAYYIIVYVTGWKSSMVIEFSVDSFNSIRFGLWLC